MGRSAADAPELTFVPLGRDDLPRVHHWLTTQHVARWWAPTVAAREQVERDLTASVEGTDPTEVFVVHVDGEPVGLVQCYRTEDDPRWAAALAVATDPSAAAGIDYFIGDPLMVGRGLGTRMIIEFAASVFERYPEVTQILVDPPADNRPSWRVLERAGFTLVWTGMVDDDDAANTGIAHVYRLTREEAGATGG